MKQISFRILSFILFIKFSLQQEEFYNRPDMLGFQAWNLNISSKYAKTYFVAHQDYFRSHWVGGYSFCAAVGLEMLTFESTEEQTVFMKFLRTNTTVVSAIMGTRFNIYLGMVAAFLPTTAAGFFWYRSGVPILQTVKDLEWWTAQPDNLGGKEYCGSIMQRPQLWDIAANDYQCDINDVNVRFFFNNAIVCQYRYNNTGGFKSKYA